MKNEIEQQAENDFAQWMAMLWVFNLEMKNSLGDSLVNELQFSTFERVEDGKGSLEERYVLELSPIGETTRRLIFESKYLNSKETGRVEARYEEDLADGRKIFVDIGEGVDEFKLDEESVVVAGGGSWLRQEMVIGREGVMRSKRVDVILGRVGEVGEIGNS